MERGWRCSLTMVCCRSCRFATCIRVHRFPLLTLFSLRLPKPDNKLSNHLSLFLSLLSSLFSLSSNTAFHAFPRFRTEEDPEEGNFRVISSPFLFFFFPRDEREKYCIGSQNEVSTAGWEHVGLRFAGYLAVDEQSSGDRGPG